MDMAPSTVHNPTGKDPADRTQEVPTMFTTTTTVAHDVGERLTVDLSASAGHDSWIVANGSPIFQVEVTSPVIVHRSVCAETGEVVDEVCPGGFAKVTAGPLFEMAGRRGRFVGDVLVKPEWVV